MGKRRKEEKRSKGNGREEGNGREVKKMRKIAGKKTHVQAKIGNKEKGKRRERTK